MKRFVLAIALTLPLVCSAEETATKKKTTAASAKAATKKTTAVPKALTIPAGAVHTGDNAYSYTDEKGKKWIYYQTPFGVTRMEEPTAEQKQAAAITPVLPDYTAVEEGDKIRFSKASPFGPQTWTRGKNELTADERAVWERQKQVPAKREQ